MANGTLLTLDGVKTILQRTYGTGAYSNPEYFRVSTNTPDVSFTDSSLTTQVPISAPESIDDCDATTGWNLTVAGGNSITGNASFYKPDNGSNISLSLIKANIADANIGASKTVTTLDATNKNVMLWVYLSAAGYAKLATTNAFTYKYGNNSGVFYYDQFNTADLTTGWNYLTSPVSALSASGSPTIASLNYFEVNFTTANATDTTSDGDFIFDSIRLASDDDYIKALESVVIDEVDGSVALQGKLSVSEANGFLLDGFAPENTDATPLMHSKSKTSQNSKGTSDLFKYTQKFKFRNA